MHCAHEATDDARTTHRFLQLLLDSTFRSTVSTLNPSTRLHAEVRHEAAFRAWVRTLDTSKSPPLVLPSLFALEALSQSFDDEYGPDMWWEWPAWSTCGSCAAKECADCPQCRQLVGFGMYNAPESDETWLYPAELAPSSTWSQAPPLIRVDTSWGDELTPHPLL